MTALTADPAPRDIRLSLALEGGLALPESGTIALLYPRAGEILDALPAARLLVVTPHVADHAFFAAHGLALRQQPEEAGKVAAVFVCLPRARAEARDLVAHAAAITDGPVIVDGQKNDGIDTMLRALRERVTLSGPIAKGHGKIGWFISPGGAALSDWRAEEATLADDSGRRFVTLPGLFSADAPDPGSALLAAALPAGLSGEGADLGAGWGYLSACLLARAPGITALHLIESDARALDCARRNLDGSRARFHWADATQPLPGMQLDFVITNPPFHVGRAGRPELGAAFIRAAAAMLKPGGRLWLVANRHLPYEAALAASFRKAGEFAPGSAGFKLMLGEGPLRMAKTTAARRRATGSKGKRR
ncbi:MAG: class I SAM-dependent methyltransferase [Pararhodobacter sp.]|nr:class I SAM-dependent methyltransferase [Pararhodobacter sp.]